MTEALEKALNKLAEAPPQEQERILTLILADLEQTRLPEEADALTPDSDGFLEKLLKIKIEAPADFSENFELYASGEKRMEDAVE